MKKTELYDEHIKLNAKMVEFASFLMPLQYENILEEHNNVRNNIGLFDVSHMGEVIVSSSDSLKFLQTLFPQDLEDMEIYQAKYCQMLDEKAGIIDDLIVYRLEESKYLLILNAARLDEDLDWLISSSKKKEYDLKIENISDNYSLLALQGPFSSDLIEKVGISKEKQPKFFSITRIKLADFNCYLSRTGYTGEDGFEILIENKNVKEIWNLLLEEGQEFNIKPIGLAARDTLRLEAGLPLYGHDLDLDTTPIEAGLSWSISKNKEQDYNGKYRIIDQLKNGVEKKLIGFSMIDKAIARQGYDIYFNGNKIGEVTSGSVAPSLNKNIGLGYILEENNLQISDKIQILIRNKLYNAEIVKIPFVKKRYKK